MPLDLLLRFGLLLLVVVIAFAVSSLVGMVVVRVLAKPDLPRDEPAVSRPRPSTLDPAPGAPAGWPPPEKLAPAADPIA
jgi:hypothetical protein